MSKSNTIPLTVGACNFDFPSKLPDDVVLNTNWNPLRPENTYLGCPPRKGLVESDVQKVLEEAFKKGLNTKGTDNMNKEQPKLDRIRGLIEGFMLALEATDKEEVLDTSSLLEKILKVIEE